MSKARDIADLGTNDVLETTSTGVDVTGTVTADGATFDGYVTVNNSMDLNGALFPDSIFMMDSKPVVFGSDTDVEVFWGGSYLNLQTKGNDIRIMDGLDTKVIWDASAESLGIGTSSPDASLHVNKDGGTSADVARSAKFESGATNSAPDVLIIDADNSSIRPSLKIKSGAGDIFNVMSDGNVGIGTSSPSENLHIVDSAFATLQIESTGASSDPELLLTNDNGGASEWSLRLDKSNSDIFQIRYNNASKMILDTSGNVGIGTSSPSEKLHVQGEIVAGTSGYTSGRSGNTGLVSYNSSTLVENIDALYLRKEGTNDSSVGIAFGNASGDNPFVGARIKHVRSGSNSNGHLTFETKDDSSINNTVERMRIDSAGRVTMPYQPAFSAKSNNSNLQSSGYIYLGSSLSGQSASVFNNVGNHFSSSTGRFTAPVAGNYFFSIMASPSQGANSILQFHVNGSGHGAAAYTYLSSYNGSSISAVIYLAAGDYVQGVFQPVNGTTESNYNGNFSGFLIG